MNNSNISLLQNSSRGDIKYDPVPHIVIKNCLPQKYYDLLEANYIPDEDLIKKHSRKNVFINPGENVRVHTLFEDVIYDRVEWSGSEIWKEFIQYHSSDNFFRDILNLFGPEIKTMFPHLESKLGTSLDQVPVKLYNKNAINTVEESKSIYLDGDLGINTTSKSTSSVRAHHVDGMQKIFAGLLYFKRKDDYASGGDLEFYRIKYNEPLTINKSVQLKPNQVEFVSKIKYEPNTAILWINSPNAVHNVTPRGPSKVSRRLLYFSGRVDDKTLFYKGLFPHAWPEQEYWFIRIYKDLNPKIIHLYYKFKQFIKKIKKK